MKIVILLTALFFIPFLLTQTWRKLDLPYLWITYLITTIAIIIEPYFVLRWENFIYNTPGKVVCYNFILGYFMLLPIALGFQAVCNWHYIFKPNFLNKRK
jgi:hypothetical protein